jgi:hypothetical protein
MQWSFIYVTAKSISRIEPAAFWETLSKGWVSLTAYNRPVSFIPRSRNRNVLHLSELLSGAPLYYATRKVSKQALTWGCALTTTCKTVVKIARIRDN